MSKRTQEDVALAEEAEKAQAVAAETQDNSGDDSDAESIPEEDRIVNIDFDYFDPNPEIDFQAYRNLMRQLLDSDAVLFDLSALADLMLQNCSLGSTIKTDGKESDPFALLTVLNIQQHKDTPVMKSLLSYMLEKTNKSPEMNMFLRKLFSQSKTSTGLILSERLINMPVEVVPPMYKMLQTEIAKAVENKEPYEFGHYIVISKTFIEASTSIEEEDTKKTKKVKHEPQQLFFFHPEDEVLQKHAKYHQSFKFTKTSQEADSRRTFQDYGIFPRFHIMVLDKDGLEKAVAEMEVKFAPS